MRFVWVAVGVVAIAVAGGIAAAFAFGEAYMIDAREYPHDDH